MLEHQDDLPFLPLRRRLLQGLGAQGFSKAVHIVIRLSEVPLLLAFWGTQLYGEWLMLSAIPALDGLPLANCPEQERYQF